MINRLRRFYRWYTTPLLLVASSVLAVSTLASYNESDLARRTSNDFRRENQALSATVDTLRTEAALSNAEKVALQKDKSDLSGKVDQLQIDMKRIDRQLNRVLSRTTPDMIHIYGQTDLTRAELERRSSSYHGQRIFIPEYSSDDYVTYKFEGFYVVERDRKPEQRPSGNDASQILEDYYPWIEAFALYSSDLCKNPAKEAERIANDVTSVKYIPERAEHDKPFYKQRVLEVAQQVCAN
ncbi:MAG: hypothetical protein HYW22_01930 [Candidatus Aenigmarchaeota archaeon]|nr:hypothetical protein [Candidatus Aenigmarchaeota archaeon]